MRVLIAVDCYLPSTRSVAALIHDLARELHRQGHDVTILTADDAVPGPMLVGDEADVRVVRVRSPKLKDVPKLRRALGELRLSGLLWRRAAPLLRRDRHDLVVYYSPSIFLAGLVRRLKRAWGCPSYLVLRDIFPEWARQVGEVPDGPAYWFCKVMEHRNYAAADVIGVQSPGDLAYFQDSPYRAHHRVEVLRNWVARQPEGRPAPGTPWRDRLGLDGKVVFFFGGVMGPAQDMPNLLRLAAAMRDDPRSHFLFVGEGAAVPRMRRAIGRLGLANVTLHPPVGQDAYRDLLAEIDVGLTTLDARLPNNNVPGKILGYLAAGKPILASLNPGNELLTLLPAAGAGFAHVNGDDAALLASARRLADDSDLRAHGAKEPAAAGRGVLGRGCRDEAPARRHGATSRRRTGRHTGRGPAGGGSDPDGTLMRHRNEIILRVDPRTCRPRGSFGTAPR